MSKDSENYVEKENIDSSCNDDEPEEHCAKWKKPDTKVT